MSRRLLFISMIVLGRAVGLSAQERVVTVPPDSVGILNAVINGDTLVGNVRVDPRTVYELQRNGVYKLTGEIQNPGFPLTIRAAAGEGALPVLQPTPPSGGESQSPFNVLAEFTLENVYVTAVDDFGRYIERLIRVRSDSTTVRLNGCWFDGTGQSIVRLDNVGAKVYLTNCRISHVGRTFVPNNGRLIDARQNTDSVVITNSTIFNVTSRVLRITGGSYYRYVDFSQNTVVNVAQRSIGFDQTVEARLTNNLVINPGFLGDIRTSEYVEIDSLNRALSELFTEQGIEQSIDVRNNLFYTTEALAAGRGDSIGNQPVYSSDLYGLSVLDSAELIDNATFTAPVQLKNAPPVPEAVLLGMIDDQLFGENPDQGSAPNWNLLASPFNLLVDNALPLPWEFPYDFSYSPLSVAATAATDGGPLGDRNWPPEEFDIVTALPDAEAPSLRLYPNPATSVIQLRTSEVPPLTLTLYTLLGRPVGYYPQAAQVPINVAHLPPGVYVAVVQGPRGVVHRTQLIKQ